MAILNGEEFHWTKLKLIQVDCPFCKSRNSSVYHRYGEELQYTLSQCKNCEMIYQNPRFEYNQTFLDWAYSWYGDGFIGQFKEKDFKSLVEDQTGYFQSKKKLIEKFCQARPYRLLDVGCACGQFLSFFQDSKCIPVGLETSAKQVKFIQDHLHFEAFCGEMSSLLPEHQASFDVTHIAHTLEHLPYPRESLTQLVSLTRPGGLVFIEVPNVRSYQNEMNRLKTRWGLRKNRWKANEFPEHLVEFFPSSIKKLMESAGLEIVYFQVHSKGLLNHGKPWVIPLEHWTNRVIPWANNMICIARRTIRSNS